jgi:glutaredoxin 3
MSAIEVYTTPYCFYCAAAKDLLRRKGAQFTEIDVSMNAERMTEMVKRANGRLTVPQIFIGAAHIGGCDDLYALDQAGGLDPMLAV